MTFRRWPAGITWIPRLREWDAVVLVDLPELERSALAEFELAAPVGADAVAREGATVPRRVVDRIVEELDVRVDRPYDALVVRKGRLTWSAGARTVRLGDTVALPAGFPATSLEVVRTPDGALEARADGEEIASTVEPLYADAVAELERRGRERFESFVVRADKVAGGTWQLTIDPL
jgi:hypothetical protein